MALKPVLSPSPRLQAGHPEEFQSGRRYHPQPDHDDHTSEYGQHAGNGRARSLGLGNHCVLRRNYRCDHELDTGGLMWDVRMVHGQREAERLRLPEAGCELAGLPEARRRRRRRPGPANVSGTNHRIASDWRDYSLDQQERLNPSTAGVPGQHCQTNDASGNPNGRLAVHWTLATNIHQAASER